MRKTLEKETGPDSTALNAIARSSGFIFVCAAMGMDISSGRVT